MTRHSWSRAASLGAGALLFAQLHVQGVFGLGQDSCVAFTSSPSLFAIVSGGKAAPIFLSEDEWPGVQRAASDFASDILGVAGVKPSLMNVTASSTSFPSSTPVLIGTLGKSSLIDAVVNRTKLDVSSIEGKWEAFMSAEVANPLPGIQKAYVIVGSDKRGSIYALYEHSEQFGVSPWYWWADVPTTKHNNLFVASSGCSHGTPTVKYRGIFLNDEQPALQSWAMEKFTNGTGASLTGSPFNHLFYTKLFELLLRLRPTTCGQWSSAFGVDDSQNQPLADWYGIVMGTSHEEPMMRSVPVEWGLFGGRGACSPYENVITIGMRGNGDLPLESEGDKITLMEKIVNDERQLLLDVYNTTDPTTIPQVWTLYKEVQQYYDEGMPVPDDVMLMWTDDNWGNVRRYPVVSERNRTGGSGVYYHVDYVGDPRDYKWITSSQIEKTFDQMSTAVAREATNIWILNVGDLKPYEMHTEFFLTYGYDATKWNPTNLRSFVTGWAQREFDLSASDAAEVANIVANVTRHNARRKPEMWNSTTYSLTHYREAENVLASLQSAADAASRIYGSLSAAAKPSFFELVYHPAQATFTLASMWISAGINNLRASQARISANEYMAQVEQRFDEDYALEVDYHGLLEGKWDHMMDQTHVMYYYWQQPMANTMPFVTKMQATKQALSGAMRIAVEGSEGAWPGDNVNNCAQGYNCGNPSLTLDPFVPTGNRYVDVGAGGPSPFTFTVSSNASWVTLSTTKGSISTDNSEERVFLGVDWDKITGVQAAVVTIKATIPGQSSMSVPVTLTADKTVVPSDFHGFVESDGAVSIEAAHAMRNSSVEGIAWTEIPGLGRTLSGITPWPRGGAELNFTAGSGPSIEYDFYLFNTKNQGGNVTVTTFVSPSLNSLGDSRPLGIALQIDNGTPKTTYFVPKTAAGQVTPAPWGGADGWVANSIISVPMVLPVQPGAHTLKVWMIEPTVVVQKIVIDTGGVQKSYLGPPESDVVKIQNSCATEAFVLPQLAEKIQKACEIARNHGFRYIWIDTCCIDKTSSAELSKAINSMYNWYRCSKACYAYLVDVDDREDPHYYHLLGSIWFRLEVIGTKHQLADFIAGRTRINAKILRHESTLTDVCVAERMLWASRRQTTEEEDKAYCLIGIFGVHLTPIYGEGQHAFTRLQRAILEQIPDQSIFAWGIRPSFPLSLNKPLQRRQMTVATSVQVSGYQSSYLLAASPLDFDCSLDIISIPLHTLSLRLGIHVTYPDYTTTSYGMRTSFPLLPFYDDNGAELMLAFLACVDVTGRLIALVLRPSQSQSSSAEMFVGAMFPQNRTQVSVDATRLHDTGSRILSDYYRLSLPLEEQTISRDAHIHQALCILHPSERPQVTLARWCTPLLTKQGYSVSHLNEYHLRPPEFTLYYPGSATVNIRIEHCACENGRQTGLLRAVLSPSSHTQQSTSPSDHRGGFRFTGPPRCHDDHIQSWDLRDGVATKTFPLPSKGTTKRRLRLTLSLTETGHIHSSKTYVLDIEVLHRSIDGRTASDIVSHSPQDDNDSVEQRFERTQVVPPKTHAAAKERTALLSQHVRVR
ncbi:uncharacterized protein BXZ73DRAFT_104577 [Epithele typhae]|uniref:uncharacterized protein n=1 Tax=Epithele typhae TaxID=378194 RepID=UPI002007877A|nr:uncharacterized protein BXZ73DRAFT_104577 [Epithele typhae]KAH9920841.1 hypothetical protein BXZ73DRAFT_104577 [Epithele typhae]